MTNNSQIQQPPSQLKQGQLFNRNTCNTSSNLSSKSVSFHESVEGPVAEDPSPSTVFAPPEPELGPRQQAMPPPPPPSCRSTFVTGRRASSGTEQSPPQPLIPRGRTASPAAVTPAVTATLRDSRRSPTAVSAAAPTRKGFLTGNSMVIEWDWVYERKRASQGNNPKRVKPLSAVMRSTPTPITAKGTKLAPVGAYITHIDEIPTTFALPVTTLFLSNNSLADTKGVSQFVNAKTVSYANNVIRYLHDLVYLSDLKHMEKLSLDGNIVVHMPYYRQFVLAICPQLEFLDGVRVSATEKQAADVHRRKAAALLEQLRTNELRAAVLVHFTSSVTCHRELMLTVRGKFR